LSTPTAERDGSRTDRIELVHSIPFLIFHAIAIAMAFTVDFEWWYLGLCAASYYVRMFGITGGFHRYFSHRGYRTSRAGQFVLAFLGGAAAQKGALWWAAHHRHHHKYSDEDEDVHSPTLRGFLWSHVGWILSSKYKATEWKLVNDFAKFPELAFLNKHYWFAPAVLGAGSYLAGGWSVFTWAFMVPTVLLWHGTFFINSLAHVFGRRRFPTTDTSRNSFLLSLLTLGEGWHNNHHHFPNTANNGFYWWEVDVTYYVLRVLSWTGLVWDLRVPPQRVLDQGRLPMEEQMAALGRAARDAFHRVGESATAAKEAAGEVAMEALQRLNPPAVAEEAGGR
jgi:stearoyl-CoA desaturase (Delta-9 desaturase)